MSFYGVLGGNPRREPISWGLCLEDVSQTSVALYGCTVGKLGRGISSTGKFEN